MISTAFVAVLWLLSSLRRLPVNHLLEIDDFSGFFFSLPHWSFGRGEGREEEIFAIRKSVTDSVNVGND